MKLAVRNHTQVTLNNKTNSPYFFSDEYSIDAFRSGADFHSSLIIYLSDEKGEVITELESSEQYSASIYIIDQKGHVSTSLLNVHLINNTFVFENLKLQGVPQSSASLSIKSPQVLVEVGGQHSKMYEFKIKVNFRECQKGEHQNLLGTCDLCLEGFYSLFTNENCKKCPEKR